MAVTGPECGVDIMDAPPNRRRAGDPVPDVRGTPTPQVRALCQLGPDPSLCESVPAVLRVCVSAPRACVGWV